TGAAPAADVAEMSAEAGALAAPEVPVVETDNDFDARELGRLAVGVDTSILPPELTAKEADPLSQQLLGQLLTHGEGAALTARAGEAADEEAGADAYDGTDTADAPAEEQAARSAEGASPVSRCLPELVEAADGPIVPVYVELARFDGEPAVIYAFAAPEPDSGEYRRIGVWAVARSDCQVLRFTQYDRPG
ncbi:MAG: hypothetical protein ACRDUY_15040, partial [Nitriliruptorales bacterium]